MIALILTLAQLLPSLLGIAGSIMNLFGATEAQIQTFQDMVTKQNELGNLSVEDHDALQGHIQAIQQRLNAKAAKK